MIIVNGVLRLDLVEKKRRNLPIFCKFHSRILCDRIGVPCLVL